MLRRIAITPRRVFEDCPRDDIVEIMELPKQQSDYDWALAHGWRDVGEVKEPGGQAK